MEDNIDDDFLRSLYETTLPKDMAFSTSQALPGFDMKSMAILQTMTVVNSFSWSKTEKQDLSQMFSGIFASFYENLLFKVS